MKKSLLGRVKLSPVMLSVLGLGSIDAAAFVENTALGLLVTGISLLVLEWRVTS